jgi:hypothetical protein
MPYEVKMKLIIITFFGVILTMTVANATEFEVGQVWSYKTRSVEKESTIAIVKIDEITEIKIIHISIDNVKIKNPQAPNGFGKTVSHLPIAEDSLKKSVTKMIGTVTSLPDFEEGYKLGERHLIVEKEAASQYQFQNVLNIWKKQLINEA